MKRIILCADDYGQNPAISQAIIHLFEKKRLSATSCMAAAPDWLQHASWLQAFEPRAFDIGLHFNLTEHVLLQKPVSLPSLMIKAFIRQLELAKVEAELHAQLDQFIKGLGRLPDFIDGHQHIQQLPVIRDAILRVYEQRLRGTNCYLRCVSDASAWRRWGESGYGKRLIIQLCGSFVWKNKLRRHNIPHNSSFAGTYHFNDSERFQLIFPQFLTRIRNNGIIMCHPGLQMTGQSDDSIVKTRYDEYCYFLSEEFQRECHQQQIEIGKFNHNI